MKISKSPLSITAGAVVFFLAGCTTSTSSSASEKIPSSDKNDNKPVEKYFGTLIDYDEKSVDGSFDESAYRRNGKTITVTAKDVSGSKLQSKISFLEEGDTLILDGSEGKFSLTTTKIEKNGISLKGINNAILDFSKTYGNFTQEDISKVIEGVREQAQTTGDHYFSTFVKNNPEYKTMYDTFGKGYGIVVYGNYNVFEDFTVQNAADNGMRFAQNISLSASHNICRNIEAKYCGDAGIQVDGRKAASFDCSEDYEEGGPHDNKFFDCYSHDNCDPWNLGENADGFALKAGAGDGNYFENCTAEYNADDGWDCYRIRGSTTWVNCRANYNGWNSATKADWGEYSNGNGFKVGGGATKDQFNGHAVNSPSLHRHAQYLKDCSAVGNRGNSGVGFDRNNQHGSIYLENCFATDNHADLMRNDYLRHENYSMSDYGDPVYIKNCFIGDPSDKYRFGNGYVPAVK